MKKLWPIAVVVLGFAALGVANVLKAPTGQSREARETQAALDRLPRTVAGWTSEDQPVPEKQLRIAQAQAHLSRVFSRENPKARIGALLLYGEPGQLGAHTPQVCFAGAGYTQIAREAKVRLDDRTELWTARFETASFPPSTLQVYWGWGADGTWRASENARLDFAGHPRIFKLYVSRAVPPSIDREATDPMPEFTNQFLKELQREMIRPRDPAEGSPNP